MTDPRLERPTWRGRTNVDALTIAALEDAEARAGWKFTVTQGSYQSTVEQSAGTHDQGGAVDLSTKGLRADQKDTLVLALRLAGFAAWRRTPAQGDWPEHVHAVVIDHPDLAPSAARQVESYRRGRNGLKGDGLDDGPRVPINPPTWPKEDPMAQYEDDLKRIEQKVDALTKAQAATDGKVDTLTNLEGRRYEANRKADRLRQDRTTARLQRLIAQGSASKADLEALLADAT